MNRKKWRDKVWERDLGICGVRVPATTCPCGTDAGALQLALDRVRKAGVYNLEHLYRVMREKGFDPHKPLWEADHIRPLDEGGKDELDNVQTACQPCHRRLTREQAARRARKRRHPKSHYSLRRDR